MVISTRSHYVVAVIRVPLVELDTPDCRTMRVEVGQLIDLGPGVALLEMPPDKQVSCLETNDEGVATL